MAVTKGGQFADGLFGEVVYSIPELFGFEPPASKQTFRAEHPYASFAAGLVTDAIPYGGWYKASKKIKRFDALVNTLGNTQKSPFLTGVLQNAARFAPLEAARVGVNAGFGDMPNSEMIGSAVTNLALGGLLGGTGEFLAAGGRRAKKFSLVENFDDTEPVQLQLRKVDDFIAQSQQLDAETLAKIKAKRSELAVVARNEQLDPELDLYVGELGSGKSNQILNMLFDSANKKELKSLVRKRFTDSAKDFKDEASWKAAAMRAGLPENFETVVQYPRYVAFTGKNAAQSAGKIEKGLLDNMDNVGDNWFITREADEGLYVMARKISGEPGTHTPADEWVILKTDNPEVVHKSAGNWAKGVAKRDAWMVEPRSAAKDMGEIGNTVKDFAEKMPLENFAVFAAPTGRGNRLYEKLLKVAGLVDDGTELEAKAKLREFIRDYLKPGMFQFGSNPRATRAMSLARMSADHADSVVDKLIYGEYKGPKGNLITESVRGRPALEISDSIKKLVDDLTERDLAGLNRLWKDEAPPEAVLDAFANGEISSAGKKLAETLLKIDAKTGESIQKLQKALGLRELELRKGHFGISREREGDQLIALRDNGNVVRAIAGGFNNRDAQRAADRLIARNPALHKAEVLDRSSLKDMPEDLRMAVSEPFFSKARHKIEGYKFDLDVWTKDELLQTIEKNLRQRVKYQTELSTKEVLRQEVNALLKEEPAMGAQLQTRINDLFGHHRPLGAWQNKVVDKILGPMLGQNSASKIVGITNTAMWNLELGAGNIGYVITQALSPIQTVIPEIAYVLNGPGRDKAAYYDVFAVSGANGPKGTLGVLSPMKLAWGAFRDMKKPSDSLKQVFTRAVNERVVDPRLIEDYVGESAAKVSDLRNAFSSGGGFVEWMRALSEFLPANAERLSRAYALTVGHKIGGEFLGLAGDDLYRFSKQFTNRTSFLYGAADRPGMFTTPAGTLFGQFKNWMMNYIFMMGDYTHQGFARGNWAPLMWQQAGTWAVGGLAASPLINVADMMNEAFSDKTLMENSYDAFGNNVADGVFYGLPSVLANTSLTSQTSTPFTNPARDAEMLFSFVLQSRSEQVGKAIGELIDVWDATGEHPAKSAKARDMLIRAFAPRSVYKTFAAFEDEHLKSLSTGYPLVKDLSFGDKVLFSLGVPPDSLQRYYDVSNILWREKEARVAEVQKLGQAYYEAVVRRDSDMQRVIMKKAQLQGISSQVLTSANTRLGNAAEDSIERNFGADTKLRMRKLLQD